MSMISYPVLRMINLRLQQFKNNNHEPFGGCNIILMGDLLQLKPIYGGCIFEQPRELIGEINIWRLFNMNVLWRNQRHVGDTAYGDLCSRIRVGKQTPNDLKILNDRMIYYHKNKSEFEDAIHLCSTKNAVNKRNEIGLAKAAINNTVYKVNSYDTYAVGPNINKVALKKHY